MNWFVCYESLLSLAEYVWSSKTALLFLVLDKARVLQGQQKVN